MRLLLILILCLLSRCLSAATGDIESKLLSPSVLVGETTQMLIRVEGTQHAFIGSLPEPPGLQLKLLETTSPARGPVRDTLFRLSVRPLQEGTITTPEIPIEILSKKKRAPAQTLNSLSPATINWTTQDLQEFEIDYGTRWTIEKTELYAGESTSIALHVYMPRLAGPAKLAFPRDQSKGIAVTPLLPTDPYKPADEAIGQTLLRGRIYDVFVFSAKATAIAGGKLSLGPTRIPAIVKVRRTEGIQARNFSLETSLPIPDIELTGLPFPSSPPRGFDGAIGEFDLSAKIRAGKLTPGAPVELELTVKGKGNFADLPAPRLLKAGSWKIASVRRLGTKKSRGKAPARFQYLLTHPKTPAHLPALELISFSPEKHRFDTTNTPEIPLQWSGARSATASLTTPASTDSASSDPFAPINLNSPSPSYSNEFPMPFWWSRAVAIAACLPLLVLVGMGIIRKNRIKHPERVLIDKVQRIPLKLDSQDYLHQVGCLLEENLPESNRPTEAQRIIDLRNEHCYKPEKSDLEIPKSERREWIKQIYRALSALILLACLGSQPAKAAWWPPTSNELTNSGSAHASKQNWTAAAKNLRQAIAADPDNQQAQSRLDLVHQNANTLLPEPNFWKASLGKFHRSSYQQTAFIAFFIGLYAIALAFASGKNWRPAVVLALACSVISGFAFYTYHNYPYHHSVIELSDRALLDKTSSLHKLPLTSSEASFLPAATPVVIKARRSPWLHIESPDLKTYWVREKDVLAMDQLPH